MTKRIAPFLGLLFLLVFMELILFSAVASYYQDIEKAHDPAPKKPCEVHRYEVVKIEGYTYYNYGHGLTPTPETLKRCIKESR